MLLASNHMFPTGSVEVVFERIAAAGAGGLDLFPPHIPYLNQPRFSEKNLALCRMAAEAAGLPIRSIIGSAAQGGKGFTAYQDADEKQGRADAVAFIRHNIELATALGAEQICSAEGRCPDGADEKVIWARLVAALK